MAVMTGTAYLEKQQFLDNFWADWKPILGKGHVIQSLKKCDFSPIYEWHMAEREKRKALDKEVRHADCSQSLCSSSPGSLAPDDWPLHLWHLTLILLQ